MKIFSTLIKYNAILLTLWICIASIANWRLFASTCQKMAYVLRYNVMSSRQFRRFVLSTGVRSFGDHSTRSYWSKLHLAAFLLFNCAVYCLRRRFWPNSLRPQYDSLWSQWSTLYGSAGATGSRRMSGGWGENATHTGGGGGGVLGNGCGEIFVSLDDNGDTNCKSRPDSTLLDSAAAMGANGQPQESSNTTGQNSSTPGLLRCVSEKIRKTKAELSRSGWIHGFYIVGLILYSAIGGLIFSTLDGSSSDAILEKRQYTCSGYLKRLIMNFTRFCLNNTLCESEVENLQTNLSDWCEKRKHDHEMTQYSTSVYMNAVIYAITVYTTIGYGTISMSSRQGRLATILYTLIGIPLFFAFLNDMGQWFQRLFLISYSRLRRFCKKHWICYGKPKKILKEELRMDHNTMTVIENGTVAAPNKEKPKKAGAARRRHVHRHSKPGLIFVCAVLFLIFYFLLVSIIFCLLENWDPFQSFWFLFQSISLIGFGDIFPSNPSTVLFTITFIIIGISLLSMCFFILQEFIRENTNKLSRRVRYSVRNWRPMRSLSAHYQGRHWSHNSRFWRSTNCALMPPDGTLGGAATVDLPRRQKTFPPMTVTKRTTFCLPSENNNNHTVEVVLADPSPVTVATPKTAAKKPPLKRKPLLLRNNTIWSLKKKASKLSLKKNSFGGTVAAGRFQFVPAAVKGESSDDESDSCEGNLDQSPYTENSLTQWIYTTSGQRSNMVQRLTTPQELSEWLLNQCSLFDQVCLLLVSTLTLPPFFLGALGVKFNGRIKIGFCSPNTLSESSESRTILGVNDQNNRTKVDGSSDVEGGKDEAPGSRTFIAKQRTSANSEFGRGRYYIVSRRNGVPYSSEADQLLTYQRLVGYLKWLAPDMNDVFVFTLFVTNALALVSIFDLARASPLQRTIHLF
uniref:Potassium channel domain-containing protein n=1 Tax=Romanomermis culicivorax TaxID=13658 RepID=A0A915IZF7_ROMCU